MYYEERLIDGVVYVRYTPTGKWIEKSKTGYQPKNSKVYSVDLANVGGALPNYSDDVNTESALNMGRTLDIGKQ